MAQTYYIGADGGGTRTTACLLSSNGEILAVHKGGGLNYHAIGLEKARENLKSIVLSLLPGEYENAVIGAGLSALDDKATREQLLSFCGDVFSPDRMLLHSDAYMALMAATLGKKGVLAISGPGSMIVSSDENGIQTPAGGWGYLLGDEGSSYSIAVRGLKAAIRFYEGTGEETSLLSKAMEFFSLSSFRSLIDKIYDPNTMPSDIAKFAKEVLTEAKNGDAVSYEIAKDEITSLASTLSALVKDDPPETAWVFGGVFEHNSWMIDLFEEALKKRCPNMKAALIPMSPAVGAAIYAMKQKNALTDEVLSNIQSAYREWNL